MRLNAPRKNIHGQTHEGAPAAPMNAEQALRRSVMACLLWESEFYESGEDIATRIYKLAQELPPAKVAALAIETREQGNLRHVPLVLLSALAKSGKGERLVAETIARVIQRADELSEFLVVHAKLNGVSPAQLKPKISAQMKLGVASAFGKFGAYALAKYDRAGAVRLRDVLFLTHPKPKDAEQEALWKQLVANKLTPPDTWEVALSGGADKKETFERLIREGNLGYFALLRNLRNMVQAGCDEALVRDAIVARKNGAERVLPFRYIAAARAAPQFEPVLDQALGAAIAGLPVLPGKTVILVDVSGSMVAPLSGRSDLQRIDAAAGLASIWPGNAALFSFSNSLVEVPPRRGMAGVDAIIGSQGHGGTELGKAVALINRQVKHDRLIVITDEQSHDRVEEPVCPRAYMINVASNQRGVGYGRWTHIDGFSESVLKFIVALEADAQD